MDTPEPKRVPVTWDKDTDINELTVAASSKVRHYIEENLAQLFELLKDEGMNLENPKIVWDLVGIPLRNIANVLEVEMEANEGFLDKIPEAKERESAPL